MKRADILILGLIVLLLGAPVQSDEQKIDLKDVPKAVIDAVKSRFPQGELKEAAKESEGGETVYEIALLNAGKHVTVSVDDEGEIEEIESVVAIADLPKAVIEALAKNYPKATIKSAEELVDAEDGKNETSYELQINMPNGESVEVVIAANGELEKKSHRDEWTSDFSAEKNDLVSTGRNPYFILEPGHQIVLEAGNERVTMTVLDETKTVDGVETRVVEERETKGGAVVEVSRNFFAISKRTNSVYYFGEDVDEYKDGKVAGHGGTWLAGRDGSYGLMMPGLPLLGARFYQELAPGKALDRAEIVGLNETVATPAGRFEQCLKIEETTPLESGEREFKLYAPGIGLVQDGSLRLVRHGKAAPRN